MTKAEVSAREEKPAAEKQPEKEARQTSLEEQARAQRRIAALERKIGQQQVELDFFAASLAASQGSAPAERRAWRDGVYEVIQAMTASRSQGEIGIERMCQLAGISRSGYYRHWQLSAPRQEETGLRNAIQRLALQHRHYGYRRIGVLLRREGRQANHKRVLRLMREDNFLCLRQTPFVPATTNSRHNWCVVPNLTRGIMLNGLDQLWVADITYLHLAEEFGYLAVILDAFSPQGCRLGAGCASAGGAGHFGADDHGKATKTRQSDPSFRSGCPICVQRIRGNPGDARHPAQYEPCRQLLRQRQGRKLHENSEAGRN
jgi:hypothetical protein